ncbi:MAG: hypothetical protein J7L41_01475 [Synergistetes bacterium]|nr:hypothetical protein [Synergistota bacterium]
MKEHWFEFFVLLLYISLSLFYPGKVQQAFWVGIGLFFKMLPIFASVVLFSTFLGVFLSPKFIQRFVGKDSGIKGIIIAVILGTVIVGPMWVMFPMFKTFMEKGARVAVVVALVGTFAVKTPWLPYAATFLGWEFVIVSVVLIVCYAVVSGLAMERLLGE